MKRGEIVRVVSPPPDPANPTHVQTGTRPALIVQHDTTIEGVRTLTVAPLTSQMKARRFPCSVVIHPTVLNGLAQPSVVLVHQIATVDRRVVDRRIGELDSADLERVEVALRAYLGL